MKNQTDKTSVQNFDPKRTKVLLGACLWDVNILPKLSETLNFLLSRPPMGFPASSVGKESTCNAGDLSSIPGLGRSPGEGKGYALQYSGLENFMDCIVQGVAKSWTWLSKFHFHFLSPNLVHTLAHRHSCGTSSLRALWTINSSLHTGQVSLWVFRAHCEWESHKLKGGLLA